MSIPNLPNGIYEIWVENVNGSSKKTSPQYINISNQSLIRPEITKSYPQNVSQNSTVTVEGSGFDQYNNTINSTLGTIHNVSSNNGKLQFLISDFPQAKTIKSSNFPNGMLVTYSVNTSKGQSKNFGFFAFSSSVAEKKQGIFGKLISALNNLIIPLPAFAYGRMYDGGPTDTKGVDTECTCSGSTLLKFDSSLDYQTHYYVDQDGVSTLVGSTIGVMSEGNDYLTTVYPYGVCEIIEGEECNNSDNTPEGTLNIAGADLVSG